MRNDDFHHLLEQAGDEQPTLVEGDTQTLPLQGQSTKKNSTDRQPPDLSSMSSSSRGEGSSLEPTSRPTHSLSSNSEASSSTVTTTSSSGSTSSTVTPATDPDPPPKTCVETLCYETNANTGVNSLYLVDFTSFATLFPRDNQAMRVTRVEFFTGYIIGQHRVEIQADSGGRPGTVRGSGQFQARILQGWHSARIEPPVELSPANPHWITWTPRSGALGSTASIFGGESIFGLETRIFSPEWSSTALSLKMRVHCCNY